MPEVSPMLLQTIAMTQRRLRQANSTDANYPSGANERKPRLAYTAGADNQPSGIGATAAQSTDAAVFDLSNWKVQPNTDGVIDRVAKPIQNVAKLCFFGTSAADQTFKARVLGWHYVIDRDADPAKETANWNPITLCELLITLGTMTGPGGIVPTTQFYADTIALVGTAGNDDVSIDIVSPADNTIAHIVVDMKGAQKLEVIFDRNASAASCNGLVSMY